MPANDLAVAKGEDHEDLVVDLDAARLPTPGFPRDQQDPVSGVDDLLDLELPVLPGSGPNPHRFRNARTAPVHLAFGADGCIEDDVRVIEGERRLVLAPEGCIQVPAHDLHVLLRHRYSDSSAASRVFFHPSCSTNHSCQTIKPRGDNFTAVPPSLKS